MKVIIPNLIVANSVLSLEAVRRTTESNSVPTGNVVQTQFTRASEELGGHLRRPTKVDYVPKWEYLVLRRRLANNLRGRGRPRHRAWRVAPTWAEKRKGADGIRAFSMSYFQNSKLRGKLCQILIFILCFDSMG